VPYGAVFSVHDGDHVEAGQQIATWDPHTHPVITEVKGRVAFSEVSEGVTVSRKIDEITGLTSIEVMDPNNAPVTPKIRGRW
jgi:DNA-directed RNA polymerase subunit beta'